MEKRCWWYGQSGQQGGGILEKQSLMSCPTGQGGPREPGPANLASPGQDWGVVGGSL